MNQPLEKTFSLLQQTGNEAAVGLLDMALDSPHANIQARALRALCQRQGESALLGILRRWHLLGESRKQLLAEFRTQLSAALRQAILSPDEQLVRNGCDAARCMQECELIPSLLSVAENLDHPQADLATDTLISLVEILDEPGPGDGEAHQVRQRHGVRRHVVPVLEAAARRFESHLNPRLLEAFLTLASRDSAWLIQVLWNTGHLAHSKVVHLLSGSPRPGILRLLLSYLDDPHPPPAVVEVLTQRTDLMFVRHLTQRLTERLPEPARRCLRKAMSFAWLQEGLPLLSALSDQEQRGALELVLASGARPRWGLKAIEFCLRQGGLAARRAAIFRLAEFRGLEVDRLTVEAVRDPDPQVQKRAAELLWERAIPGAVPTLIELLQSPHALVREAARRPLAAFTFQHYAAIYETLDDAGRQDTGRIVKRVDPGAVEELRLRLNAEARAPRLRTIEMVVAMDAVSELEDELIALAQHDDYLTRVEAVHALAHAHSAASYEALRRACTDEMASVRQAARDALGFRERMAVEAGRSGDARGPRSELMPNDVVNPRLLES